MELNLWHNKSFKGYLLISLLQNWLQKPMSEGKENREQEKEVADLTKIISMLWILPMCEKTILYFHSGFSKLVLVLENVIYLLGERKPLMRCHLTSFTTKHIIGRFWSSMQSWPAGVHMIFRGHFQDVMYLKLNFTTGCCTCYASACK